MKKVELIFAEFGNDRINAGSVQSLPFERLEPSLTSTYNTLEKQYDVKVKVYTDVENPNFSSNIPHTVECRRLEASTYFEETHFRYGWRCNDYYKVLGLMESDADVAISLDSDMFCYSDKFLDLIEITKRFGVCLPKNPRNLILVDSIIGEDGVMEEQEYMKKAKRDWWDCLSEEEQGQVVDEKLGEGSHMMANNMSPIAFDTSNARARTLLKAYCKLMLSEPKRGPHNMWRASWLTGVNPLILPEEWCVCASSVGIRNEVMLHMGHPEVSKHYFSPDAPLNEWQSKERAKRYRGYDESYDTYNILFGEKITEICQSYDKKINVLDLACGTGRYFHRLKNVNKLVGVDFSQPMLDEALNPTRLEQIDWWNDCQTEKNIKLVCEDLAGFLFPRSVTRHRDWGTQSFDSSGYFDLIFSIGAISEYESLMPITNSLLANVKRMLSPKGVFLFTINEKILPEEPLRLLMEQSCMSELDIQIENVSFDPSDEHAWRHSVVVVRK